MTDAEREALLAKLRARTATRLQRGMIVMFDSRRCRVVYVNDCRAKIVPVTKRVREFVPSTGINAGKARVFEEVEDGFNISPNSEIDIVGYEKDPTV